MEELKKQYAQNREEKRRKYNKPTSPYMELKRLREGKNK